MSELKPCPFCGGRGESMIRGQWYKIVCQNCWAESNEEPTYADAGNRWNERVTDAKIAQLEQHVKELERDAKRYRHLKRNADNEFTAEIGQPVLMIAGFNFLKNGWDDEIDKAIDAAMEKSDAAK